MSQVQSEKRSPERTKFTTGSRAAQAKMFVHKDFDKVIQYMIHIVDSFKLHVIEVRYHMRCHEVIADIVREAWYR